MEEELSRPSDFVLSPSISKEDLDLRARMAKYFSPLSSVSSKIADKIKEENKELFTCSGRLSSLVEIYVGMEERGAILELSRASLSSDEKQEWIHFVSYSIELNLLGGHFKGQQEFLQSRALFNEVYKRNNGLLYQDPPNVFYSLGQILGSEMEKSIKISATEKMIRYVIKVYLKGHPELLDVLAEGLRPPWMVKKTRG